MSEEAREILQRTPIVARTGPYALGAWPREMLRGIFNGRPFEIAYAMIDDCEATALVPESELDRLPPPASVARGWSILTLDAFIDWNVVGIFATITQALAEAGITVGAVSAFSRDHILVPTDRLGDAKTCLEGLCSRFVLR